MITNTDIQKAADLLREGRLVAFPTETVYGLGGDATNEVAVRSIFTAKERPYNHSLIVHIGHIKQLLDWAIDLPPDALKLAKAFWPGPLTLILKKQPHVLGLVTSQQETVGIRIPKHPVAQALLEAFGGGIAAPSANRFTHISPTTAEAVYEELGNKADMILDGGPCTVGLESTIIDVTGEAPIILRPGMMSMQAMTDVLGKNIQVVTQETTVRTPGMYHVHYAPTTKTIMATKPEIEAILQAMTPASPPIACLLYHPLTVSPDLPVRCVVLHQDATSYAHDLYATLRSLDHLDVSYIVIEQPPATPDWLAINDRLKKTVGSRT